MINYVFTVHKQIFNYHTRLCLTEQLEDAEANEVIACEDGKKFTRLYGACGIKFK